ncbi:MAG: pyridoxal phosphate-dependent aminotransferase family protein, partial [Bacteroidota bacterium]
MNQEFLSNRLNVRVGQGALRKLHAENNLIDFSSNDYLGFARSEELKRLSAEEILPPKSLILNFNGSTGSRLLTGNSQYAEELEKFIAEYHHAEAGLIFNSGYDANLGLISSIAQKEDLIFYDELSHASIYDGVRLSKAESFPFKHNDLTHLENRLKHLLPPSGGGGAVFVIVESVYSMDGDFAPLKEISSLCAEYKVNL